MMRGRGRSGPGRNPHLPDDERDILDDTGGPARQVSEPIQPADGEPAPPLVRRVLADAQVMGDPVVAPATGSSQHDLRAQPVPVGRLRPPDAVLQVVRSRRSA